MGDLFMKYRTKTYIAGDWTGDSDAVEELYKWNRSDYWGLSFQNAHDITQSNDKSRNCSIKASLRSRLNVSKTFVLIVGNGTKSRRAGECNYCSNNNDCGSSSNKSFIEYECDKAVRDGLKIIVLYKATTIDKNKCPDVIKNVGNHIAMLCRMNGEIYWDYQAVKNAMQ